MSLKLLAVFPPSELVDGMNMYMGFITENETVTQDENHYLHDRVPFFEGLQAIITDGALLAAGTVLSKNTKIGRREVYFGVPGQSVRERRERVTNGVVEEYVLETVTQYTKRGKLNCVTSQLVTTLGADGTTIEEIKIFTFGIDGKISNLEIALNAATRARDLICWTCVELMQLTHTRCMTPWNKSATLSGYRHEQEPQGRDGVHVRSCAPSAAASASCRDRACKSDAAADGTPPPALRRMALP